uniref:RNA-directed DNA polymerase n=1 Tax=Strongyloides papillosus TaxID=174720 RepID=A0A0N5C531_STREA
MVVTRSKRELKPIRTSTRDGNRITKSAEYDEIIRRARRTARGEESTTSDDVIDDVDNPGVYSSGNDDVKYDESIGRRSTNDDDCVVMTQPLSHVSPLPQNVVMTGQPNSRRDYHMNAQVFAGFERIYFKEDMVPRPTIPRFPMYIPNVMSVNDDVNSQRGERVKSKVNDNQNLRKKESKFGKYYPRKMPDEDDERRYSNREGYSDEFSNFSQYNVNYQPQYPPYAAPVYNVVPSCNVKIDAYDPKEDFSLFLERFERRVASDIQKQPYIKSNYGELIRYLKENYKGEESLAAARQKLMNLKLNRSSELVTVGAEISRLIDVVYSGESHRERLRRKRNHLAECLPAGLMRSLIKHDRPEDEPFDHTILVAKDYWDDINASSKSKRSEGARDKFQGECNFCKKRGHKEVDCRLKKKKDKSLKEVNQSEKVNKMVKGEVKESNSADSVRGEVNLEKPGSDLPIIQVKVNGCDSIKMLVDTGSEITILPMRFRSECAIDEENKLKIRTLNDHGAITSYKTKEEVNFNIGDKIINCFAYLCDIDFTNRAYEGILGWNVFKQLVVTFDDKNEKIVFREFNKPDESNVAEINVSIIDEVDKSHEEVVKLKVEFDDIIAKNEYDLGSGKIKCHNIVLKDNCEFPRPATIPIQEVDKPILKEYLDNLEASGVIVRKPSPYAMPIFMLKKSDGRRRIIGDMRSINAIVQPIYYSPPLVPNAILKMRNCSYFTKLDCNNAYFQVGVPEESQVYLAVKTPFGTYRFRRMVQGFINSSSEYQRIGEEVLHGLEEYCTNYIDDIVVHTAGSLEFHISKVKEVLLRIRDADFRISFEKCSFFGKSIKYLGFHINVDGSVPHDSNIKAFLKRPFPESKKSLKSLIASANYYRNYIENFSDLTYHLDELLKKKYRKLVWNDVAKQSYHKLIQAMSSPKFCHHPVLEEDFILTTDSSDHSVGGVLSQMRNGKEVPISFYSKRLTPTKRKRCITYKELMAISRCFRHFKHYFGGSRIHIRTDHLPLIGIFKNSVDNRYLELTNDLAGFDFKVHYVKGSSNVVSDDLSREVYDPKDNNFSGDEDGSDVETNIKCVNVADFLSAIDMNVYNIDEDSDDDSILYDSHYNECNVDVNAVVKGNANPGKRPRGRPKKCIKVVKIAKRGRPKKSQENKPERSENDVKPCKNSEIPQKKRRRGRPKKVVTVESDDDSNHPLMELVENLNGNLNVDFIKHQKEDKHIQESIKIGNYDGKEVVVIDDVAYVKTNHPKEGQELKRIIPSSLDNKMLCLAHNLRGHFGIVKTKHLINQVGYMKSLHDKVEKHILKCDECMKRNSPNILHPKMQHVTEYTMPFQNLAGDICGPIIPTSSNGHKYLLVFIDSFTRFTIIIPCRSYSFDEVFQKIMDEIIWKHGNPLSIRTDNGPNFKNEKLIEVFKTIGIRQEFSTIYHNRGNAICERALKWIRNTIAKLSPREKDGISILKHYGFTSFYLHYMRNPNTELETLLNVQKNYRVDKNQELVELIDVAKEAYKEAKWNIDRNIDRRPEGKYRENDLKVDEFVYLKFPDPTCGSKLALN